MQDLDPKKWKRNEEPKTFINPLNKIFSFDRLNDQNTVESYIFTPIGIYTYPTFLADFFITKIVDEIISDRGLGYLTPEERSEIAKEVTSL